MTCNFVWFQFVMRTPINHVNYHNEGFYIEGRYDEHSYELVMLGLLIILTDSVTMFKKNFGFSKIQNIGFGLIYINPEFFYRETVSVNPVTSETSLVLLRWRLINIRLCWFISTQVICGKLVVSFNKIEYTM